MHPEFKKVKASDIQVGDWIVMSENKKTVDVQRVRETKHYDGLVDLEFGNGDVLRFLNQDRELKIWRNW